jgi:hypothetical protein
MTHRIRTRKFFIGAALGAAAVIVGGTATALQRQATDPPSPAAGHSQVVATWLVNLGDGPYEWNLAEHQVDSVGIDLTHSAPTFLIGYGEYSTVITGPEVRGRLADGEALFRRPTLTTHAAALGGEPATLMEWILSPDDTGPGSDPFEPGAGDHDIDIIRDWLAPSETFTMTAGIPAFVVVSSGWVTTADGTRIDAGGWATLQGDIALTNGGEEPAVLLAAWISPVLELPAAPTTTTSTPITSSEPTSDIAPVTAAPTPAAPPTTATPPTTVAAAAPATTAAAAAPATTAAPTDSSSTTTSPSTTVAEPTTTWETTTTWPSTTVAEPTTTWPPPETTEP